MRACWCSWFRLLQSELAHVSWPASLTDISVFRMEHPESVRFNQVVVFGRRKKAHLRGEPKGAEELLRIAYKPQLLPLLNQEVA